MVDFPDGYQRFSPGIVTEMESGYALPWCESFSGNIGAGGSATYTLTFSDAAYIFKVDMISVTPTRNTEFYVRASVGDVAYVAAAGSGWINIPLSQNPALQFVAGDHIDILVTNLDGSTRAFDCKLNGTKIKKPAGF